MQDVLRGLGKGDEIMNGNENIALKNFLANYQITELHNKNYEETFFEITRHTRKRNEEIFTKVLRFFLEYKKTSKIILDCLLRLCEIEDSRESLERAKLEENAHGLRIDLYLETTDYCIGIEVKLGASMYNNFYAYAQYTEQDAKNKEKDYKFIILAKNEGELKEKKKELENAGKQENFNFHFISLRKLKEEIEGKYSEILKDCNYKYFLYLKDLLEEMHAGATKMNREFIETTKGHYREIANIKNNCVGVKDRLNEIARSFNVFPPNDLYFEAYPHEYFHFSDAYFEGDCTEAGSTFRFSCGVDIIVDKVVISIFFFEHINEDVNSKDFWKAIKTKIENFDEDFVLLNRQAFESQLNEGKIENFEDDFPKIPKAHDGSKADSIRAVYKKVFPYKLFDDDSEDKMKEEVGGLVKGFLGKLLGKELKT